MSLKFTGELCVMTMKNDPKIEVEMTCQFKIDLRNLTKFDPSTRNLKNLHFNRLILTKVNNVWAKKSIKELFLMELNIDVKFEGKITCASKNDMRNLAHFHQSICPQV